MILWHVGADQRVAGRLQISTCQDRKLSPDVRSSELIWAQTGPIKTLAVEGDSVIGVLYRACKLNPLLRRQLVRCPPLALFELKLHRPQ